MSDESVKLPDALPEEDDYEPDLMTLQDEEGVEHCFEVLDATDIDDVRYLAVAPHEPDPKKGLEEPAEMFIMRLGEVDGEEYLDVVDDEEELQRVGQVFLNRLSEVYDIDVEELRKELGQQ